MMRTRLVDWKVVIVVAGVVGLGALAAVQDARAGSDQKDYAGSLCVAAGAGVTDEGLDERYGYSLEGWLENYSTTAVLPIVCPTTQDWARNNSTGHWFSVRDDHTTQDVKCRFEIRSGTGTAYFGSYAYSSGASTTPAVYSLTSPTDSPSYGVVIMYCELPPWESGRWRNLMTGYSMDEYVP